MKYNFNHEAKLSLRGILENVLIISSIDKI